MQTEIFNRDINPSQRLAQTYPDLGPLIANDALLRVFDDYERDARRWKRVYVGLGMIALICIFLAMVLFDFQFALQGAYPIPRSLSVLGEIVAAVGLASQIALLTGGVSDRWLMARFAAERVRCLKFQAFALIAQSPDAATLQAKVDAFVTEQLARLEQELMGGRSAVEEFSPSELLPVPKTQATDASAELLRDGAVVYDSLRLGVQAQHLERQAHICESRARLPALVSEATFVIGGVMALSQILFIAWSGLLLHAMPILGGQTQSWIGFVTLLMFVISAIVAVYQRGSGNEFHMERYKHYAREVRRIRTRANEGSTPLIETVAQMEDVAFREIFDFCRDARHSNYIF